MVYNLQNYLSMRRGGNSSEELQPKPESQIQQLLEHISSVDPQVLGVCEIGGRAELNDLQTRLAQRGLHYRYSHWTTGSDMQRKLGILSKIPLKTYQAAPLEFEMSGHTHKVSRGILDVSIQLNSGEVRLVGVHLKSKRPSKYWDQQLLRRHEARVVRQYVDSLLKSDASRVLLYGDFNDTKNTPTIRAIKGTHTPSTTLRAVELSAKDGSKWTHYWEHQDTYARVDYVFANTAMRKTIMPKKSYILDVPHSCTASDHRPLVVTFR